jgi:hypothetical protein
MNLNKIIDNDDNFHITDFEHIVYKGLNRWKSAVSICITDPPEISMQKYSILQLSEYHILII